MNNGARGEEKINRPRSGAFENSDRAWLAEAQASERARVRQTGSELKLP